MKKTLRFVPLLALGLVAMAASSYSYAQNSAPVAASKKTQDFVTNATIGGEYEIESSKLALTKSSSDAIKKFAQEMIDDHGKAGDQLKNAVNTANLTVTMPAGLDSKHQKILDKENTKNGADFDRQYVKDQNKAHDETIKLFKNYAKGGDNTTVQTFAAQTLPILAQHKQMAEQLKVTRY